MNRISVILVTYCLSFLALSAQTITVGSYNIRYHNAGDSINQNGWKQRYSTICDIINYEEPCVLGAQEVLVDQLHDMLALLPDYAYIGVGRDDGKEAGEYAAIFYNREQVRLLDEGHFWLSENPTRPGLGWDAACVRICSWGKFKELRSGKKFFFFNLHMDHVGIVARREAARLVVEQIGLIAKGAPVVLTGDFNVDQTNEIYEIFTQSGLLKDSFVAAKRRLAPNGTFNSFDVNLKSPSRIDHIFVSPSTSVERYAVRTDSYWIPSNDYEAFAERKGNDAPQEISFRAYERRNPSDHYPVFAKIILKK